MPPVLIDLPHHPQAPAQQPIQTPADSEKPFRVGGVGERQETDESGFSSFSSVRAVRAGGFVALKFSAPGYDSVYLVVEKTPVCVVAILTKSAEG
jgi:hypothetical protein